MKINQLPLLELFTKLRESGLSLGIEEYNLVLQSLQAGFGIPGKSDLSRLCCLLWVKSPDEKLIFDNYFDQLIPEQVSFLSGDETFTEENLTSEETGVLNPGNKKSFSPEQLEVRPSKPQNTNLGSLNDDRQTENTQTNFQRNRISDYLTQLGNQINDRLNLVVRITTFSGVSLGVALLASLILPRTIPPSSYTEELETDASNSSISSELTTPSQSSESVVPTEASSNSPPSTTDSLNPPNPSSSRLPTSISQSSESVVPTEASSNSPPNTTDSLNPPNPSSSRLPTSISQSSESVVPTEASSNSPPSTTDSLNPPNPSSSRLPTSISQSSESVVPTEASSNSPPNTTDSLNPPNPSSSQLSTSTPNPYVIWVARITSPIIYLASSIFILSALVLLLSLLIRLIRKGKDNIYSIPVLKTLPQPESVISDKKQHDQQIQDELQFTIRQSIEMSERWRSSNYLRVKEYLPITHRQMKQGWRYLRRLVREGPEIELDLSATIKQIGEQGFLLKPILVPPRINKTRLLLLIDQDGSMRPFNNISSQLAETAKSSGRLGKADIYYFYNCPDQYVYIDPLFLEGESISKLLRNLPAQTILLIFSDAGAARGGDNEERVKLTQDFLDELRQYIRYIVWLNPMSCDRWPDTTAAKISRLVPMFEINHQGFLRAINCLRGR